jgi:ankyrin repeat protein
MHSATLPPTPQQEGHTDLIAALLAAGADPATPAYNGVTAVEVAASKGFTKMVAVLQRYGGAET